MQRIPVAGVIRETYEFVLANFGAIFRLTWVSALLLEGSQFLLTQLPSDDMSGRAVAFTLAATGLYFFFYSVMTVAVARFALGSSAGRIVAHFTLGRPELTMFRSSMVVVLLTIIVGLLGLFLIAFIGIAGSIASGMDARAWASSWPVVGFAVVFVAGVWVFTIARYWFFLPLAAVLAPNQWVSRSYDLSAGNLWHIVAVLVGVALPFVGLHFAELGWQVLDAWRSGGLHVPTSLRDFSEMMNQVSASSDAAQAASWQKSVLQLAWNVVSTVAWVGLEVTAAVLTYRALVGRTPDSTSAVFD